ncbi:hypothetical protein MMC26_006561 [Xylographa opegraphella]|nr:hypothetical protein [Xylographa opegraphella]
MASIINRSSRSRRMPVRKRPSEASMFSILTHNSNGSNGSNTTVTPQSIAKVRQPSSKPVASRKSAATRPTKKKASQSAPIMPPVEERPNVFEFIVEDEEEGIGRGNAVELDGAQTTQSVRIRTTSISSSSSAERTYYTRSRSTQDDRHHRWNERSFPSGSSFTDSGISVRSSSPERDSSAIRHKVLELPADNGNCKEVEDGGPNDYTDRFATSPRVLEPFDGGPETSPEVFYRMPSRPSFQDDGFDVSIGQLPSRRSNCIVDEIQAKAHATSEDSVRFDRNGLASHISLDRAAGLKPIYRKFEKLNNRALLHLQSEISGLEIQLENVDKVFADTSKASESGARSADVASYNPQRLQWQRAELMRQILTNLERYNNALSSYSRLSEHVGTASEKDICSYKEWINQDSLLIAARTAFHNHHEDLVTIVTKNNFKATSSEKSAAVTGSTLLITIVAFRIMPQFISRLVFGIVIGLAMSCSGIPSTSMHRHCLREYGQRAFLYACIMVVLAVAIA